jgi:hypothetical protein
VPEKKALNEWWMSNEWLMFLQKWKFKQLMQSSKHPPRLCGYASQITKFTCPMLQNKWSS